MRTEAEISARLRILTSQLHEWQATEKFLRGKLAAGDPSFKQEDLQNLLTRMQQLKDEVKTLEWVADLH